MNVVLARIGKPHGLRGEVTVQLHTDDPETRFAVGTVVATEAEPGSGVPTALTIASTRVHRGIWLLTFEEIPDRTGAESLRGTRLVLPESDPQAEDEAYYEEDLVGLEARDTGGEVVGTVSGLEIGPAQDRLVAHADRRRHGLRAVHQAHRARRRRGPRRRRPAARPLRPLPRGHRVTADATRVPTRCASTSSRSSPTTSPPSTCRSSARPARTACSTSASTTCATSPTTGTAPSTTPRTAGERAWS